MKKKRNGQNKEEDGFLYNLTITYYCHKRKKKHIKYFILLVNNRNKAGKLTEASLHWRRRSYRILCFAKTLRIIIML